MFDLSVSRVPFECSVFAGGEPCRPESERIIFGAPQIGEEEITAVADCMRSRWIGLGPRVREFESAVAEYKGASYALAVNSKHGLRVVED